eukprot:scaffold34615_cov180-Amphora_coffeaeformis.AAC.13
MGVWQAMVKALTFSRFGGAEFSRRSISRTSALRSPSRQRSRNISSLGPASCKKSNDLEVEHDEMEEVGLCLPPTTTRAWTPESIAKKRLK